jgi:hypothetical protein
MARINPDNERGKALLIHPKPAQSASRDTQGQRTRITACTHPSLTGENGGIHVRVPVAARMAQRIPA